MSSNYSRLSESRTYRARRSRSSSGLPRSQSDFNMRDSHPSNVSFLRGDGGLASLRICGPKLSTCCLLLSVWGILQLVIVGIAYQNNALAFVEDLKLEENYDDAAALKDDMEKGFERGANNCYVAALLYLVTLVVSGFQYWLNHRGTHSTGYERYTN